MRISAPDTRDGWKPRAFKVWGAVALVAIGTLHGTIVDRAIAVRLRRRRADEGVERLRLDRLGETTPLKQRVARWARDNLDSLRAADPEVPAELHDRAADNRRGLLAIADAAGGEWPERARAAALTLTRAGAEAADAESLGIQLLADFREIFDRMGRDVLTTGEIWADLKERDEQPWAEWARGAKDAKGELLRAGRKMAALLKPYGIPTNRTVRILGETFKSEGFREM